MLHRLWNDTMKSEMDLFGNVFAAELALRQLAFRRRLHLSCGVLPSHRSVSQPGGLPPVCVASEGFQESLQCFIFLRKRRSCLEKAILPRGAPPESSVKEESQHRKEDSRHRIRRWPRCSI